jgi:hypothetical protein
MNRVLRVAAFAVAALGAAETLAAQGLDWSAAAIVVGVRAQGDSSRTAGTVLGGLASARFGRLEVEGRYLQGALQSQDLVQGQLAVRYDATSWLTAQTAARARAYVTPAGTERWLVWVLGVRVATPLVGTTVRGDIGLWRALALSANVGSTQGRAGRGGEAGVTLQLVDRPWWFRLAYGIDRSTVSGAARHDTVEEFTLTVGLHRR